MDNSDLLRHPAQDLWSLGARDAGRTCGPRPAMMMMGSRTRCWRKRGIRISPGAMSILFLNNCYFGVYEAQDWMIPSGERIPRKPIIRASTVRDALMAAKQGLLGVLKELLQIPGRLKTPLKTPSETPSPPSSGR